MFFSHSSKLVNFKNIPTENPVLRHKCDIRQSVRLCDRHSKFGSGFLKFGSGFLKFGSGFINFYSNFPSPPPLDSEILKEIESDLGVILKAPPDVFENFSKRFYQFKDQQSKPNFKQLDEIALLVDDLRTIFSAVPRIDPYEVELSLSCISNYCLSLDFPRVVKSREDMLFQDLRSTLQDVAPVTPEQGVKKLTFWEDNKDTMEKIIKILPKIKSPPPSTNTQLNSVKSDSTTTSNTTILSESTPNATIDTNNNANNNPRKDFLHEQYVIISSALRQSHYQVDQTTKSLKISPRQLQNMMVQLMRKGYDFALPEDFVLHKGLVHGSVKQRTTIENENKSKEERRKTWKVYMQML